MEDLENKLDQVEQDKKQILEEIDERNKDREILCGGCKGYHKIKDLTAIQYYWHVSPHGCTGGDYWREGELIFVCPENGMVNRLLFDNNDVPFEDRKMYKNDPEEQFKRNYKKLFLEVVDNFDETIHGKWVNNFYVDKNREKFGLVEKIKK